MKNFYNLNNESIYLDDFDCGKHQKITVKLGRKTFYLDIDKNCANACVDFYNMTKNESKYGLKANLHSVFVANNALLDRDFFENIAVIQATVYFLKKYEHKIIL